MFHNRSCCIIVMWEDEKCRENSGGKYEDWSNQNCEIPWEMTWQCIFVLRWEWRGVLFRWEDCLLFLEWFVMMRSKGWREMKRSPCNERTLLYKGTLKAFQYKHLSSFLITATCHPKTLSPPPHHGESHLLVIVSILFPTWKINAIFHCYN